MAAVFAALALLAAAQEWLQRPMKMLAGIK
jgi:hypothetical protein